MSPIPLSLLCLSLAAAPVVLAQGTAIPLPEKPGGIGRSAADRATWDAIAATPEGAKAVANATPFLSKPPVPFDPSLYQEYYANGNRSRFQDHNGKRWQRLRALTLAECVEGKSRFVPAIASTVDSLCADPSWCLPAHDSNAWIFKGNKPYADLVVAASGFDMATMLCLLDDRLPEATKTLARREIARRLTGPALEQIRGGDPEFYRSRHWWSRANHNWNAVCTAGAVGAILLTEPDRATREAAVRWAEGNMKTFLSGFAADGYCSEGIGYWSYGFGHFAVLSELVCQHTNGTVDWLASDRVRQIVAATCGQEITAGIHPCFADAGLNSRPSGLVVHYLTSRGIWPGRAGKSPAAVIASAGTLYDGMLFAFPFRTSDKPASASALPSHTWLKDAGVYIGRPAPGGDFAVAFKGGNNAEHHNHNDVGTTMVYHRGQALLCDPGAMVYTAETFSKDRYRFPVMASYGHSTPVVDGRFQVAGNAARGIVLKTSFSESADRISIDLRSCYPVKDLTRLERDWTYQRGDSPSLTIDDRFACGREIPFESALVALGAWCRLPSGDLAVTGPNQAAVTVKIESSGPVATELTKIINPGRPTVFRLGIRLSNPAKDGWIRTVVSPTDPAAAKQAKPVAVTREAPAKLDVAGAD